MKNKIAQILCALDQDIYMDIICIEDEDDARWAKKLEEKDEALSMLYAMHEHGTVIFRGVMEEVFGYGIDCYADTEEECLALMKKEYASWLKDDPVRQAECSFAESARNRAATISKINLPCAGSEGACGQVVWQGDA